MKKILTSFLVFLLLFNFITCSIPVYATEGDTPDHTSDRGLMTPATPSNGVSAEIIESGTVSRQQGGATKFALGFGTVTQSVLGFITGIFARLFNILFIQLDVLAGVITASTISGPEYKSGKETEFFLTIDRCVYNKVSLFNIDYFDTEATYKVGPAEVESNATNNKIKESIIDVFYICRMLAISISMVVLIYIGIRMAISTVSSDQARYKKMLLGWVESLVILFVTVYIMVIVIDLSELLTGIFYDFRCQIIKNNPEYGVFENTIRETTFGPLFLYSGFKLTIWSIIYYVLLYQELKFFWLYIKRFLMVGLLITVSPLITITYSIDKAGDGKAQVFSSWMKEFTVNVFIQPLHALIYAIFVLTANALASNSPLVAIALLMTMGTAERMVKVIFDLKGLTTLSGINKFNMKG